MVPSYISILLLHISILLLHIAHRDATANGRRETGSGAFVRQHGAFLPVKIQGHVLLTCIFYSSKYSSKY